jgi:hypothetical protein
MGRIHLHRMLLPAVMGSGALLHRLGRMKMGIIGIEGGLIRGLWMKVIEILGAR